MTGRRIALLMALLATTASGCITTACASAGRMNSTANGRANSTATTAVKPMRPRVISLAPSLTEIAYAVGCGDLLVGDTRFDDYPAAAKALPHVADLAHADLERIVALHDQEYEGGTIEARLRVPIVYLPNRNIGDLYADIAGVAAACAMPAQGAKLSAGLRAQIEAATRASAKRAYH